jgi:hypothetical protein
MRLLGSICLLIGMCSAVQAETLFYSCTTRQSNGDWIPKELYIAIEDGEAVVNDPVINAIFGKPIPAQIETDNAKRITLRWKLSGTKDSSGQYAANFQYSATILKANNKLSMTAVPVGYSNNFNGFGTCTVERK